MTRTSNTKLLPPGRRSPIIERPALHGRLAAIQELKLLLICAPAGYGKTTALMQAYEDLRLRGRRVAWMSLDEDDKDLTRFAATLLDMTAIAGSVSRQNHAQHLGSVIAWSVETLRTYVLNELVTLTEEVFIVLDDYHLVAEPGIRGLVNSILLSPVQQIRFLIGSRTHNDLPVSRLRALGLIQEIEIADLTFSEREVDEFVTRVRGQPLSTRQLARLRDITESWAASLQMAAIALREVKDVDGFLDVFSGETRSVGDFLGDEILRRLPDKLVEFMTITSILKQFNWRLCDAVTGTGDGRTMLEEVEQRNLFLFSLDPARKWFRYHNLFSSFLRRRFVDRYPERVQTAHLLACEWLAGHGFTIDAIEHAFEADAQERAGELLDRVSADLFAAGRTTTLMDFASRLPKALLERLPRLQLERAWHSELSWKFADARIALEHVQRVLADRHTACREPASEQTFLASKLAHRQMMLMLLSDDARGTIRQAGEWIAEDTTQDAFMRASAGTALMIASRTMFRCEGVHTSARMLHARYIEGGALYGVVFHQCAVGATLFERGELAPAQDAYDRALEAAVELHGEHSALYNMPALMCGELCYERNQLDRAEEILAQRDIASQLGFADNLVAGFITRTRLHAIKGRWLDAEALLREGVWLATQLGFGRMQAALLDERMRILLAGDEECEAERLYRDSQRPSGAHQFSAPHEGSTLEELYLAMAFARECIRSGKAREAVTVLKAWFAFTRGRHCHRSAIRSGILLTLALLSAGDRRNALRTLYESLVLGERGGFIRSFVDEGANVADLIDEIERLPRPKSDSHFLSYVGVVRHAFKDSDDRIPLRTSKRSEGVSEDGLLSPREMQVIELAARGLQNADIARALFLAQSTVKWYWQRIFEKLKVRRRPDVIRVARLNHWIH